jgi:Uncharacterized protein conserved in bacteria
VTALSDRNWKSEIEALAAREADFYRQTQIDFCAEWVRKCESPIEQIFAAHLVNWAYLAEFRRQFDRVTLCDKPELVGKAQMTPAPGHCLVSAQQSVGRYRVDFMAIAAARDSKHTCRVVVECDGHEFHERTKEQAKRDKSRDRVLAIQGFKVLRFTGSELCADPARCFADFEELIFTDLHQYAEVALAAAE